MFEYYILQFWEIITIKFLLIFIWVYYVMLWIMLFFWVGYDIKKRTQNIFYRIISQFLQILPPPIGYVLYVIIRPRKDDNKEFIEEVDENITSLQIYIEEKNKLISHMQENTLFICHECNNEVEEDFIICPNCLASLHHPCRKCGQEIRATWEICPYCKRSQKEIFHFNKYK